MTFRHHYIEYKIYIFCNKLNNVLVQNSANDPHAYAITFYIAMLWVNLFWNPLHNMELVLNSSYVNKLRIWNYVMRVKCRCIHSSKLIILGANCLEIHYISWNLGVNNLRNYVICVGQWWMSTINHFQTQWNNM